MKSLRRLFFAALFCLTTPATQAADVMVFAATSLKESLDAVARQFEAGSGHKVVISYAASSALARQIEAGAPADIFISADLDWVEYLAQRKLTVSASRKNLLTNEMVLIAPISSNASLKIAPQFPLATALGTGRLALAQPDSVPAGKYGKAALEKLGVWPAVATKIVPAENVRATLMLVARGEAPFGIVYKTDALAERNVKIVDTFAASSHPAIVYPATRIATSQSEAAAAFFSYLNHANTKTIWEKYGFGLVTQ